mmetsp:Transcript_24964/g.68844  ORF Transcript_24964/g.68844 Transcript_24964/m.68844 type:complete len:314 (+) Transcript_24964:249-1190(+)
MHRPHILQPLNQIDSRFVWIFLCQFANESWEKIRKNSSSLFLQIFLHGGFLIRRIARQLFFNLALNHVVRKCAGESHVTLALVVAPPANTCLVLLPHVEANKFFRYFRIFEVEFNEVFVFLFKVIVWILCSRFGCLLATSVPRWLAFVVGIHKIVSRFRKRNHVVVLRRPNLRVIVVTDIQYDDWVVPIILLCPTAIGYGNDAVVLLDLWVTDARIWQRCFALQLFVLRFFVFPIGFAWIVIRSGAILVTVGATIRFLSIMAIDFHIVFLSFLSVGGLFRGRCLRLACNLITAYSFRRCPRFCFIGHERWLGY